MSISSLLMATVLAAIPLTLILAAMPAGLQTRRFALNDHQRWRFAWRAVQLVAVFTLTAVASSFMLPDADLHWFSDSPLRLTLLVLLSVMALVVVKFSYRYLAAEPGFGRYLRYWFMDCGLKACFAGGADCGSSQYCALYGVCHRHTCGDGGGLLSIWS